MTHEREVAASPEPTPVDELLQAHRPLLDRGANSPRDAIGRVLRGARRAAAAVGPEWYEEQRDFEIRLRQAIAYLARQAEAERLAREAAEGRLAELFARVDVQGRGLAQTNADLADAVLRLRALEARARAGALERARLTATPGDAGREGASESAIPALDDFDYLAFEDRFRGPEDLIRERQQVHAARLEGAGEVADLGCGRGEMLKLLRERGIEAIGVDASAEMVTVAREKGLRAEHGDMFAFLADRPAASLGGIVCSHVLEHLWPADHVRFARLCAAGLRPAGILIVETPNPRSLVAGAVNFSCDPTHLRPVFPETLAFVLEQAGFERVEIEYLSPMPDAHRALPATGAPPELSDLVAQLNLAIERLDSLVFGYQEYAVIGRRGTG